MRCTTCAGTVRTIGNQWFCDECSQVQRVVIKSPPRELLREAGLAPLVYAKRCRTCGSEFFTKEKKHRFCATCLPEWAKQAAASRQAPEPA